VTSYEISRIGTGAIHKRYQKFPVNPLEKYQTNPDNKIDKRMYTLFEISPLVCLGVSM
jgi:hypothetical protein